MTPYKFLASAFHAARSRFGNTGILAATIYRNSRQANNASPSKDLSQPAPQDATADVMGRGYSPPDFKSQSEITASKIADLAKQYSARSVDLVPLGDMVARQDAIIANAIFEFFQRTTSLREVTVPALTAYISEFRNIFLTSPFANNSGGANFTTAMNIFLIARCLSPRLIVECGVFKGASSYILRAACPHAQILAFDPNLTELAYRTPGVTYYEYDWMCRDVRCDRIGTGLCYFDDHQNQATRIIEAHKRGFRHLLLDDSWPIEVPGSGWPPMPSLDMLMNNWLKIGETEQWLDHGKLFTYLHTEQSHQLMTQARSLIKGAYDLPTLYRETGVAPTSAGKFAELM